MGVLDTLGPYLPGLAALGVAAAGHELTHAAVARAFGGRVRIDWWALECHYALADERRWPHYAVLAAPLATGLAVGAAWVLTTGWPTVGPRSGLWALAWALYTFGGGLDDLRIQPAPEEGDNAGGDEADETGVTGDAVAGVGPEWVFLGLCLGAFYGGWALFAVAAGLPRGWAAVLQSVAGGLYLAGPFLLLFGVEAYADGADHAEWPLSGD